MTYDIDLMIKVFSVQRKHASSGVSNFKKFKFQKIGQPSK